MSLTREVRVHFFGVLKIYFMDRYEAKKKSGGI